MINSVDEFILLEDVQYTRRDWRNRNLIKTPTGLKWLTIPVIQKGNREMEIREITVSGPDWQKQHWDDLHRYYSGALYFSEYGEEFREIYLNNKEKLLTEINCKFIIEVNRILGIKTLISRSTDYASVGKKNTKLISLCKACGADTYLSGPSAKSYIDETLFDAEGIRLEWMDYDGYPEYRQLYPPFKHEVSILDLIFNAGPQAADYMKSFKTP
jgi:hypothetical protein